MRYNYHKIILEIIKKEIRNGDKIIEIGGARGYLIKELEKTQKNKYYYTDIIKRKDKRFILDNIEHSKIKNKQYDIVFSEGLIEHTNIEKSIREMCRISKRTVIIFFPNGLNIFYNIEKWIERMNGRFWIGADEYGFEQNINPFKIIKIMIQEKYKTELVGINSLKRDLIMPQYLKSNVCIIGRIVQ